MAAGYDGSIRIDTSIDTKGINKGTKSIGSSLSGVLRALKFVGAAMGVAFSGAAIFSFIKNAMAQFDLMKSAIGGNIQAVSTSFSGLQGAIANVGAAFLIGLTPYIITAVTWLTSLFNIIAQVVSVLFGVQAGMGAVANSTNSAAGAQGKLAKETKKSAKEARGALAAFDQLNVLETPKPADVPTPDAGGGGGAVKPVLPALAIPSGLLASVEAFKNKMLDFLQPVTDALSRLGGALTPLGETIWSGLKWAWDNILVPLGTWTITELLPHFLDLVGAAATVLNTALIALQPLGIWLWENFLQPLATWTGDAIILALQGMTKHLENVSVWINNNQTLFSALAAVLAIVVIALYAFFSPMGTFIAFWAIVIALVVTLVHYWPVLTEAVKNAWARIMQIISPVVAWMTELFTRFFSFATNMWNVWLAVVKNILLLLWLYFKTTFIDPITNLLSLFGLTWSDVWEGLKTGFGTVMDWLGDKFTKVFNAFKPIAKGVVNFIIDILNGLHAGFVKTVNGIIGGANKLGGKLPGWSIIPTISAMQIPRLATGAVIPPNARFAAILGDQKSGRNLEAPEGLIRQIVREESGGGGSKDIVIRFEGSMAQFVRELKPFIDNENKRVGGSLLSGGLA